MKADAIFVCLMIFLVGWLINGDHKTQLNKTLLCVDSDMESCANYLCWNE